MSRAQGRRGALIATMAPFQVPYDTVAMQAIQMHGGIGFTWEHPAHLFLRRARTGLQLFGGPRLHRERYLISKGA